jgi:hypothetical protein
MNQTIARQTPWARTRSHDLDAWHLRLPKSLTGPVDVRASLLGLSRAAYIAAALLIAEDLDKQTIHDAANRFGIVHGVRVVVGRTRSDR